jgi:protein-tyrosine phosphatase
MEVIFVCLGNICRSPMAEAIFKDILAQSGLSDEFQVSSAGTGAWHVGEPACFGTRKVLADHNIGCDSVARQVTRAELARADYVIALDRSNARDIRRMARDANVEERLHLLLDFAEGEKRQDVPDPYYEGNFELVYRLVRAGCEGLLVHIHRQTA